MRRAVLTILAAVGVGAGLAVTASSTTNVAARHGMHGLALGAVVVVLEVTNVLGTWTLLTDTRTGARWQAGLLVGVASVVTAVCGFQTYGPIGLVGPFFVLAGVHLAGLGASSPTGPAQDDDPGEPAQADAHTPAQTPTEEADAQDAPGPPAEPLASEAPSTTPDARPEDAQIVAALCARSPMPGRDAVKAEFRIGTRRAERVLDAAQRPALFSVKEAQR